MDIHAGSRLGSHLTARNCLDRIGSLSCSSGWQFASPCAASWHCSCNHWQQPSSASRVQSAKHLPSAHAGPLSEVSSGTDVSQPAALVITSPVSTTVLAAAHAVFQPIAAASLTVWWHILVHSGMHEKSIMDAVVACMACGLYCICCPSLLMRQGHARCDVGCCCYSSIGLSLVQSGSI